MPKLYGKQYTVESTRCYKCNGSTELLIPLNEARTSFQVCKCPYCVNGVATIYVLQDVEIIQPEDDD